MTPRQKLPFKELKKHEKVNRIFTYIVFGTVFVFTFCWIDENLRSGQPLVIFLSVFGALVLVEIILWITLFFVFKRKGMSQNEKNIEAKLKEIKQEEKNQDEPETPIDRLKNLEDEGTET